MTRKRRTPEEAKAEILEAAERVVLEDGPSALKIQRVAKMVGVSHPAVLHHFGSAQQLLLALQKKMARSVREDFLLLIDAQNHPHDRLRLIDEALKTLSAPKNGRILAFLLSSGIDPFPPEEEKGLAQISTQLGVNTGYQIDELNNVLLLAMLSMYADGMMGGLLRARLFPSQQEPESFRRWMLRLVGQHLAQTSELKSQGEPAASTPDPVL